MKVIFLDVDGVLHPANEKHRPCKKPCMDLLKAIVEEGGAHIVLSSNWRLEAWGVRQLDNHLRKHGIEPVHDCTHAVEDVFNTRADEILDWLHRHPNVEHFVCLDDVPLNFEDEDAPVPPSLAARFVHTSESHGLRDPDRAAALACLDLPLERSDLPPAKLLDGGEAHGQGGALPEVLSTPDQTSALNAGASNAGSNTGSFKGRFVGSRPLSREVSFSRTISRTPSGTCLPALATRTGKVPSRSPSLQSLALLSRNPSLENLATLASDVAGTVSAFLSDLIVLPPAAEPEVWKPHSNSSSRSRSRRASRGDLEGLPRD